MRCSYCQEEATHVEADPDRSADDEKRKSRWYCNRHAAERLLENCEVRIDQIVVED